MHRSSIESAQWVGMSAFCAARVEQKIVEVPKHEAVVTLGRSETAFTGGVDLEKDSAIDKQSEKLGPGEPVKAPEAFELLRSGQHGQDSRNLWIADPKCRSAERRFQQQIVGAASQVCEPRQDENVGIVELPRLGPVIGNSAVR